MKIDPETNVETLTNSAFSAPGWGTPEKSRGSENTVLSRRGIALWMVFALLLVIVIGGIALSSLMRGLQRQVEYADAGIRAQYIGESAYNRLHARLFSKPWDERWFANGTDSGSEISLHEGEYDFFIADNPFRPRHADIFIRSSYRGTKRAFYWLVKGETDLLTGLVNGTVVGSTEFEPDNQPTSASPNTTELAKAMEKIIQIRKDKRPVSDPMTKGLNSTNKANDAIRELGGVPPSGVVQEPFDQSGAPGQTPPSTTIDPPSTQPPFTPEKVKEVPKNEKKLDWEVIPNIVGDFPNFKENLKEMGKKLNDSVAAGVTPTAGTPPTQGSGEDLTVISGYDCDLGNHMHKCSFKVKDSQGCVSSRSVTRQHVSCVRECNGKGIITFHSHGGPPPPEETVPPFD